MPSPVPSQALEQAPAAQVGCEPEQGAQALPPLPHTPFWLPGWQLFPSQQPPLHVSPPVHDVLHTCDELQACPVGQSFWLLQPHTPCTHLSPSVDDEQSGGFLQPHVVPVQFVPSFDDAQLMHCPAVPQLVGVPWQVPESWGGGGEESTTGPSLEPSRCASASIALSVAAAESDPVVPSAPDEPLSAAAGASSPVTASPTLPSLAESLRPELLRPHAPVSTPSTHESTSPDAAFFACTALG